MPSGAPDYTGMKVDVVSRPEWAAVVDMDKTIDGGTYGIAVGGIYDLEYLVPAEEPNIEYRPTPEGLRDRYQYFTEARMERLKNPFYEYQVPQAFAGAPLAEEHGSQVRPISELSGVRPLPGVAVHQVLENMSRYEL